MRTLIFLIGFALLPAPAPARLVQRDYHGFSLYIDCAHRGPTAFCTRLGGSNAL